MVFPYICQACVKANMGTGKTSPTIASKKKAEHHYASVHRQTVAKELKCNDCYQSFDSTPELEVHNPCKPPPAPAPESDED